MWRAVASLRAGQSLWSSTRNFSLPGPGKQAFDVTRHSVPLSEIMYSVPRDTIPALLEPRFIATAQARGELKDSDRVLGVFLKGKGKAYPVRILNWHEVVNDVVGDRPILVSW